MKTKKNNTKWKWKFQLKSLKKKTKKQMLH